MKEDTISLLKECNSGCKMATSSMEQVSPFIKNEQLKKMLDEYNKKHIEIGDACHQMLNNVGYDEKDPPDVQKVFSWLSTEVKLRLKEEDEKAADLLVDGCNMGIKSLSRYINKYNSASPESIDLTRRLIKIEQDFMNGLLAYL